MFIRHSNAVASLRSECGCDTGPGKLLYMAVRDFGDLRAQNQPKVCPNFGDLRVQSRKICPRLVCFWGFETDLGCFGPCPWSQNKSKINVNYGVLPGPTRHHRPNLNNGLQTTSRLHGPGPADSGHPYHL